MDYNLLTPILVDTEAGTSAQQNVDEIQTQVLQDLKLYKNRVPEKLHEIARKVLKRETDYKVIDQLVKVIEHNRQMMADKIQSYETQIMTLNEKLNPNEQEITFLMEEMQSLKSIKDILKNSYNSMLNKYKEEITAMTELEKQIEMDKNYYSTRIEEAKKKIMWNDEEITGLKQMIVAEHDRYTSEKNELNRKKRELITSLDDTNEKIKIVNKKCDTLLEMKNLRMEQVTERVGKIEKLNKELAEIPIEILNNETKIRQEKFQGGIDELETNIQELQLSTASKQIEVQVLKNRIAEIATKKSTFEEEKNRLDELITSKVLKLNNLERDLQRAKEENETLEANHSAKEAELLAMLKLGNKKITDIKEEEQAQNVELLEKTYMDKHHDYVYNSYKKELEDLNKCLEDDRVSLNTELLKGKDLLTHIDVLIAEEAEVVSNIDHLNTPVLILDNTDIKELTAMEAKVREKEEMLQKHVLEKKSIAEKSLQSKKDETLDIMKEYENKITEKMNKLSNLKSQHLTLDRKITEKKAKRMGLIEITKKEEAEIDVLQKKVNDGNIANQAKPLGILKISNTKKRPAPTTEKGSASKTVKFKTSPEFESSSGGSVESNIIRMLLASSPSSEHLHPKV